ncbi:MAG: tyrosine-type recombinase/integrase, partial [Trebonia sp.]
MNMTVAGIGSVVVGELRSAGYLESSIGRYENTVKALASFVEERDGVRYTPALGAEFASLTVGPRTGRFSAGRRFERTRLISVFDGYVRTGRVSLARRKGGGGGVPPRSCGLAALSAAWEAEMRGRALAPGTREVYGRMSRSYLVFLESRGGCCLDDADGASVLAFIESLSARWAVSSLVSAVSHLRPFLRFTGRVDLLDALALVRAKRFHAILPALRDDDERRVIAACASGPVVARDAAITLLALTVGVRACDIVNLRLGDIDWRARTVGVVQQKTRAPLTVPLSDLLARRLADYLLEERPGTDDDHVFLRRVAPHVPLTGHSALYRLIAAVFR